MPGMNQNPYEAPIVPPPPASQPSFVKFLVRAVIVFPLYLGALVFGYFAGGSIYYRTHTPPYQLLVLLSYAAGGAMVSLWLAIRVSKWLIAKLGQN
jgi:hypothetical protein